MLNTHPLIIGHRGAPGYFPEHCAASYEYAFAAGADAVEPDVVLSSDGILVIRHENEISGTTDVADRAEFAQRRTTKTINGVEYEGWFTEDFTWAELATLRCRERLPTLRPASAVHNDRQPVLRLRDLLELVDAARVSQGREIGVVVEIKHATYFAHLGWDIAARVAAELAACGWARGEHPLIIEAFESTVLRRVREWGVRASFVYLLEKSGVPADLAMTQGKNALSYPETATASGLDRLIGEVDGISVNKKMLLVPEKRGRMRRESAIVNAAHERGLTVFTWTLRPENRFLAKEFRRAATPLGDWESEWSLIGGTGVDGVFVDHPDLAVDLFSRV